MAARDQCSLDTQCTGGTCSSGYCSFPDGECPSGLRFGDLGPECYRALDDPELVRLEKLVELAADPGFTSRAARLIVQTSQGEFRSEIASVPGDPDNPLAEPDLIAKFLRFTAHLPEAAEWAESILHGAAADSLRMLRVAASTSTP